MAIHFYFQQKALLNHGFTVIDEIHLLNHFIRVDIGKESEVTAVNAHYVNIKAGEYTSSTEHIAIAANHYCEVGLLTNRDKVTNGKVIAIHFLGDAFFNKNGALFGAKIIR